MKLFQKQVISEKDGVTTYWMRPSNILLFIIAAVIIFLYFRENGK